MTINVEHIANSKMTIKNITNVTIYGVPINEIYANALKVNKLLIANFLAWKVNKNAGYFRFIYYSLIQRPIILFFKADFSWTCKNKNQTFGSSFKMFYGLVAPIWNKEVLPMGWMVWSINSLWIYSYFFVRSVFQMLMPIVIDH